MRLVLLAGTALSCAVASPILAQEPYPLARLTGPIQLDGMSDEAAWQGVEPLPATMYEPTAGLEPSERTVFRVAYDDEYLYAAGQLYDSEPDGIRATTLKRDDTSFSNDWFAIGVDGFNDRENLLLFATNPAGVRTDGVIRDGQEPTGNFDWNTFWDSAVQQTDEGWFAEIRIPLSSLRFQERDGRTLMGLLLWRRIARKNEAITFPSFPPGMGSLFRASRMQQVALEALHRENPLYATPYLLVGTGRAYALNATGTAYTANGQSVREAGLDVKYALTSNLTLDLTYNTDFAQVEADDQQVNLTRFSLFLPEKRLFFQERAAVFDFPTGQTDRLFYSRRMGLNGNQQVPILGGARLVGRVGGWDVGALNMQTAESGDVDGENLGVARVRRQVLNENSYVGGIATSRLGGAGREVLYGLDAIVRAVGQQYLILNWAQSYAEGAVDVGAFDRGLARARWERRVTDGLVWAFEASRVGSEFDPALGFQLRSDYSRLGDQIGYGWRAGRESVLLRQGLALKGYAYRDNRDGSIESARIGPEWLLETKSGHRVTVASAISREELESEFRLAESAVVPPGAYVFRAGQIDYQAPRGARLRPNVNLDIGAFYDGWQVTGRLVPTWNPSRYVELGGSYQHTRLKFPDRGQELRAHVAGVRGRVMVSTRFSASALVQYSSTAAGVFGNLRIRYNPREGDDLYLVYNTGINTDRLEYSPVRPLLDNHVLMLKYSRTFDVGL